MGIGFVDTFGGFGIIFILIFSFVIGNILFAIGKGLYTWNENNHSPQLTLLATVVAKRADVSYNHHPMGGDASYGYHTSSSTSYFVTFEFIDGERVELSVKGKVYGMIVEGDRGELSFQGSRFLSFEREIR